MKYKSLVYEPGSGKSLSEFDTGFTGKYKDKKSAESDLEKGIQKLARMQDMLYAHDKYAILIIFQAMDAAGKDGTIKHVMSGINPQGCQVTSFKVPSAEELDHDYLWRCFRQLPERGNIGIFNRSYYEEVLVTRVHPEFLNGQKLPVLPKKPEKDDAFWKQRYEDINRFEKYLVNNGTVVVKFFLHVSADEQKRRLLERIEDPSKNWKFSVRDLAERERWDDYMHAYGEMLRNTSTEYAPWYVIPADRKWFMRAAVCDILVGQMEALRLHYPIISDEQKADLVKAKEVLEG
jgi:PPK2 family polyphosphate:nucleotide phosphotransferase